MAVRKWLQKIPAPWGISLHTHSSVFQLLALFYRQIVQKKIWLFSFFAGRICAASLEMHLKITAHREPYVLFLFLVARGLSLKSQVVSVYKYLDWSLSGKLAESSSSLHSLKILLLFFFFTWNWLTCSRHTQWVFDAERYAGKILSLSLSRGTRRR